MAAEAAYEVASSSMARHRVCATARWAGLFLSGCGERGAGAASGPGGGVTPMGEVEGVVPSRDPCEEMHPLIPSKVVCSEFGDGAVIYLPRRDVASVHEVR